jgi:hypothetical protein
MAYRSLRTAVRGEESDTILRSGVGGGVFDYVVRS